MLVSCSIRRGTVNKLPTTSSSAASSTAISRPTCAATLRSSIQPNSRRSSIRAQPSHHQSTTTSSASSRTDSTSSTITAADLAFSSDLPDSLTADTTLRFKKSRITALNQLLTSVASSFTGLQRYQQLQRQTAAQDKDAREVIEWEDMAKRSVEEKSAEVERLKRGVSVSKRQLSQSIVEQKMEEQGKRTKQLRSKQLNKLREQLSDSHQSNSSRSRRSMDENATLDGSGEQDDSGSSSSATNFCFGVGADARVDGASKTVQSANLWAAAKLIVQEQQRSVLVKDEEKSEDESDCQQRKTKRLRLSTEAAIDGDRSVQIAEPDMEQCAQVSFLDAMNHPSNQEYRWRRQPGSTLTHRKVFIVREVEQADNLRDVLNEIRGHVSSVPAVTVLSLPVEERKEEVKGVVAKEEEKRTGHSLSHSTCKHAFAIHFR